MPVTVPVRSQKGFVTPCELFFANYIPVTGLVLITEALLSHMSSFLQNGYLYWPNSLSKKPFSSELELFSANNIHFPGRFLQRKVFVTQYELLSANCMALPAEFAFKKPLLYATTSFLSLY